MLCFLEAGLRLNEYLFGLIGTETRLTTFQGQSVSLCISHRHATRGFRNFRRVVRLSVNSFALEHRDGTGMDWAYGVEILLAVPRSMHATLGNFFSCSRQSISGRHLCKSCLSIVLRYYSKPSRVILGCVYGLVSRYASVRVEERLGDFALPRQSADAHSNTCLYLCWAILKVGARTERSDSGACAFQKILLSQP